MYIFFLRNKIFNSFCGSGGLQKFNNPFKSISVVSAWHCVFVCEHLQSNFNGSDIFGTLETCSRHGLFEPLRVNYGARLGSKW